MIRKFNFSGGEIQTELSVDKHSHLKLLHRIQSSDDFMALLMASEIIGRTKPIGKSLILPYFPYARQDRVTKREVSFSLKVAAKLIDDLGYDEVISYDVHSDVTAALVSNMRIISQAEIITQHFPELDTFIKSDITAIIAPDAGAAKKAGAVSRAYKLPLFQATKVRDISTGEIKETKIYDDVRNYECLIIDDICDGGRTFTELAKVLRDSGASKIYLYVTHGIFSKGYDVFNGLIDGLYSTDSFIPLSLPQARQVPLIVSQLNYMEI